ncbi:MAG TPA: hypothetical protein VIH37_06670 [Candidatus Limnocylindrales bacterium]
MAHEPTAGHSIAAAITLGSAGEERDYTPAVYGALLVTTLLAAQWQSASSTLFVGGSLVVSVGVFWLTHVWSGIVNERLHGPIQRHEVRRLALHESPMLVALVLPVFVLAAGQVLGGDINALVDVALVVSIVQLFLWGLAVGRAVHTSWLLAIRVAAVDCLLGIVIVVMKVFVLH